MFLLINLSCNSDDNIEENSININRRLENIIFTNTENLSSNQTNLIYDDKNNLIETRDENNLLISKYTYDNKNKLLSHEFNEYNKDQLFFKEIDVISYDSQNRIININHKSSFHSSENGVRENEPSNHKISYEENRIIKTFDGGSTNKVEYFIEGDLIKKVKLYNQDKLAGDFDFTFDSSGNCISGTGPILIGLQNELISNIDLNATYGSEKRIKQIRRPFLDYELLSLESFYTLRHIMTDQIGSNFPKEISWNESNNKQTVKNDYTLDSEGFINQNIESELPNFPNHTKVEFMWK